MAKGLSRDRNPGAAGITADPAFDRNGLIRRALPFGAVGVLALASLGLPPGPKSIHDVLVAAALSPFLSWLSRARRP